MCTHTHAHIRARARTRMHTHPCVHTRAHTRVHAQTYTHAHARVCGHTHKRAHMHMWNEGIPDARLWCHLYTEILEIVVSDKFRILPKFMILMKIRSQQIFRPQAYKILYHATLPVMIIDRMPDKSWRACGRARSRLYALPMHFPTAFGSSQALSLAQERNLRGFFLLALFWNTSTFIQMRLLARIRKMCHFQQL